MKDKDDKITEVVNFLRIEVDVDGETMEDIINQVGLQEQIHRQLVMNQPIERTERLLEERRKLDKE